MHEQAIIVGAEPYSRDGDGSRSVGVALIHGFTSSPITMRPLGLALSQRGYAVEVPRLPGHGTHWRDLARTRYSDWRKGVVETIDRLQSRCPRVVLVGLSMGGTLVLDIASERRDIAGVVAINPAILDRQGLLARLAPLLARVIPVIPSRLSGLVKNDAARPGVDEKAYAWMPTRAAESFLTELPRIRAQLRRLTVPTLIAYSLQDHSVSPENSIAIPSLAGAAAVELLPLERSYHLAPLDYDQELLEQRVVDVLERVSASPSVPHEAGRS